VTARGPYRPPLPSLLPAAMTLGDACDQFLAHCRLGKNLSANTLRAYAVDLAEFRAFVGAESTVDACDRTQLRAFLRHLVDARGLKETSVKRRMACLKVMFRWLETEEAIPLSPFHHMKLNIRLPRRLPRALTGREAQALSDAAARRLGLINGGAYDGARLAGAVDRGNFDDLTALVAIEVMVTTGVRVGELTAVRVADIDLPEATLRIIGKGNRERRVFLVDDAMTGLVGAYLGLRETVAPLTDRLLVTARGAAVAPPFLRRALRNLAEEAALTRPVTPHMLRHTAATQLLEAGVDIRFVQKLLGHQSISTTEMYTAVSDASLKTVIVGARRGRRPQTC